MSTLDGFREGMSAYRRLADEEARALKTPQLALERLRHFYERLSATEEKLADQVLAEWALSDDEAVRFDALAVINELKLVSALPALDKLVTRLASAERTSTPFELAKVHRIVNRLRH